jgi:hypothetical protein
MNQLHRTEIKAVAKHKITYELRTLLGIIGSWREVSSERVTKPSLFIETTTEEFDKVIINGKEFIEESSKVYSSYA